MCAVVAQHLNTDFWRASAPSHQLTLGDSAQTVTFSTLSNIGAVVIVVRS